MFWNDPNLYGVNFPYKENVPLMQHPFVQQPLMQHPMFMGIQQFPQQFSRFVPPIHPYMPINPMAQVPQVPQLPFMQPFNVNLPLYNWYRPFIW